MNHTFYDDVEWSYDNGLMQGITTRRFVPRNAITQATVVTVLARIANVDLSRYENDGSYPTIPIGAWYTNAVVWATRPGSFLTTPLSIVKAPSAVRTWPLCW